MKKNLTLILTGLIALGVQGQEIPIVIEKVEKSQEIQESAKKSGDLYIYSAREDLESALLRASEAWKLRQEANTKSDYLTANNIQTNLTAYTSIAILRHSAAIQEREAGNLVIGAKDSIKKAKGVYVENKVPEQIPPPGVDGYLSPVNCFLRAEGDIKAAIINYQLAKNNLGEASLREALAIDAKQRAEDYRKTTK